MELFQQYFDFMYLIIIILGGAAITSDRFTIKKPFWLASLVSKISAAWKVLIFSLVVGILLFKFDSDSTLKVLFATFLLANSFYALIGKFVMNWLTNLIGGDKTA